MSSTSALPHLRSHRQQVVNVLALRPPRTRAELGRALVWALVRMQE